MGHKILRSVLGIIAGIVTMWVVIAAIEYAGTMLYPPPAGVDARTAQGMAWILSNSPPQALAFVVVAWVVGAFAGGWAAARIARHWPRGAAIVVGAFVMLGVVGMIVQMPGHPTWMAILGLLLPVPSALLGARFARPKAPVPSIP